MYLIINGMIEFVQGRTLAINGLEVDIPKEGFAYIAAELFIEDGKLLPRVRELKGTLAERYGFMKIGSEQFEKITDQIMKRGGNGIDFGFASKFKRPKVTVNQEADMWMNKQRIEDVERRLDQLECKHENVRYRKASSCLMVERHSIRIPPWYDKICVDCGKDLGTATHSEYLGVQKKELESELEKVERDLHSESRRVSGKM